MQRILLAVDRGAPSWEAARLAVHLAPKLKARVTVLNVVVPRQREARDQRKREYEAARELVEDVVKEIRAAGTRADADVRSCRPGEVPGEVLAAATRLGADLIVMGSRARGELTGLLLGSVSQEVASRSECPVLIVPTGAMTKMAPRRIVLAIEGSNEADVPTLATAELARALTAEVEVVCVTGTSGGNVKPSEDSTGTSLDAAAVARAMATLKKAGIHVRSRILTNIRGLAPEIAQEAIVAEADLIVVGSRAATWVGADVAGDVAAAVVRRTRLPVVATPRRQRS